MVNPRLSGTNRGNVVRCRNHAKSFKSHRTPHPQTKNTIRLNLRRSHDRVLAEPPPQAIPFCHLSKTTERDRTRSGPWHRVIQGVSAKAHMVGCQDYGPFLGTLNVRCRIIIGIQKETIILTTTHMGIW